MSGVGEAGIDVTVVPDGIQPNGAYRLSLVLSPVFEGIVGPVADFWRWPGAVADLLRTRGVMVHLGGSDDGQPVKVGVGYDTAAADKLWQRLMFGDDPGMLAAIPAALRGQQAIRDDRRSQLIDPTPNGQPRQVRVIASAPQSLGRVVRAVQAGDALHGMRVRAAGPGAAAAAASPGKVLLSSDVLRAKEPATPARLADAPARQVGMRTQLRDQFAIGERLRTNVAEAPRDTVAPSRPGNTADVLSTLFVRDLATAYSRALGASGKVYDAALAGGAPAAFAGKTAAPAPHPFGRLSRTSHFDVLQASLLHDDHRTEIRTRFAGYKASTRVAWTRPKGTPAHVRMHPSAADEDRFNRKLAGIMASPSLAKFLGLIVDVDIPSALFERWLGAGGDHTGTVAVRIAPDRATPGAPARLLWTAFVRKAAVPADTYFGPASRDDTLGTAAPKPGERDRRRYVDGVQNLGFVGEDGFRFSLESIDSNALVQATELASRASAEEHGEGEPAHAVNQALPHARTHGLSLVDVMRRDRVAESLAHRPSLGSAGEPLTAEDLVIGYRVDVNWTVPAAPGKHSHWRGWRSLMERRVVLGGIHDKALQAFQAALPAQDRAREAGFVRTPVRVDSYWVDPIPGGHPDEAGTPGGRGMPPVEVAEAVSLQPPDGGPGVPPVQTGAGGVVPVGQPPPAAAAVGNPVVLDRAQPVGTPPTAPGAQSGSPPDAATKGGSPPDAESRGVPPLQVADAIAHDTMFTWRGWSLAASVKGQDLPIDATNDLAVDTVITLPSGPAAPGAPGLMWPLRFGRDYRIGLRLVWLNGSGPPLAHAHRLYESFPALTMGATEGSGLHAGTDGGYAFRRHEPVPAPDVLLVPESRTLPALTPGEQTRTMVVRSNNSGWGDAGPHVGTVSERALVPPAIIEELAALHGMFDKTPHARPVGGLRHVWRCGPHSYPWLRKGIPMCPDVKLGPGKAPTLPDSAEDDQRSVLVYRTDSHTGEQFWPDPMAADLHWAFMRGGAPAPGYPPPGKVTFYKPGAAWPDASAIRVRLHPAGPGGVAGLAHVKATPPMRRRVTSLGQSLEVTEAVLDIHLAPGETIDLLVWCHTSQHAMLYQHAAPGLLAAYAAHCGDAPGLPADLLQDVCSFHDHLCTVASGGHPPGVAHCIETMLEQHPVPVLAASHTLTLVHALTRPRRAPAVVEPLVALLRPLAGVNQVIEGRLGIDRATTASVELQARWDEYADAETVKLAAGPDGVATYLPARMSTTVTLDTPDIGGPTEASLTKDDRGQPRTVTLPLPDARARVVTVCPVARSRFAGQFTPAAADPLMFRTGTDDPQRCHRFVSRATVRPGAPVLLPDGVTLSVRQVPTPRGQQPAPHVFTLQQSVVARLLMPRGWYSSGFGELVGVIFAPAATGGATGDITDDQLLEPYLTRWGADPTRSGPALPTGAIGADRFSSWTASAEQLDLPLPVPDTAAPAAPLTRPVTVLGYAPVFDPVRRVWTVDIGIDAGGSPDAFVRLGLARYQPHAVAGVELSFPIAAWVTGLKPVRTVTVTVADGLATVEIAGNATRRTATQAAPPYVGTPVERASGLLAGTDAPLMTVRLLRGPGGRAAAPVPDPRTGLPLERHVAGTPAGQETRWKAVFPVAPDWGAAGYAVQVEEREWLAADDRATGGSVLAERGSPFHALIRLDAT